MNKCCAEYLKTDRAFCPVCLTNLCVLDPNYKRVSISCGINWSSAQQGRWESLPHNVHFHTAHDKKKYFKEHPNLTQDPEITKHVERKNKEDEATDPFPTEKISEALQETSKISVRG